MKVMQRAYHEGQLEAFRRFKVAFPVPTDPTVKSSPVLSASAKSTMPNAAPPLDPDTLSRTFNMHEQGRTRLEPPKKVAGEEDTRMCTSCRKGRHYGACAKHPQNAGAGTTLPKLADFNLGMHGEDPKHHSSTHGGPSTSPHYHSATVSDSSLARARPGNPAQQASTSFADLFRHLGITSLADQPGQATGGLLKQSLDWGTQVHSLAEKRGPSVNIYEQSLSPQRGVFPGSPDEAKGNIDRAFSSHDLFADATAIEGAMQPATGPAVLG